MEFENFYRILPATYVGVVKISPLKYGQPSGLLSFIKSANTLQVHAANTSMVNTRKGRCLLVPCACRHFHPVSRISHFQFLCIYKNIERFLQIFISSILYFCKETHNERGNVFSFTPSKPSRPLHFLTICKGNFGLTSWICSPLSDGGRGWMVSNYIQF